ncbi:MAG: TolC family protein [Polyangiales bacterium]
MIQEARAQSVASINEAEVERRVRALSPAVRAQRATLAQVDAERERAARALVPELSVTARYTRLSSVPEEFRQISLNIPGVPMMDGLVFPQLLDQFVTRASLTVPVSDLFTRALPALRAAGARAEAARLEARASEARSVFEAQSAYLQWLRARAALAVARSSRESFERTREDTARRVRAGQLALSQQLPLDVTLSSLRRQEIALEAAVRSAESTVRALLAIDAASMVPTDEELDPRAAAPSASTRPELAALDANARALEGQAGAARGALFPSLVVTGGVDVAAPNPRAFAQTTLTPLATWDVSVQLSWSLGQTLDHEAQLRVLAAQRQALEAQRDALSRALDAEVSSARAEEQAARRRIEEATTGLRAAEALAEQRRGAYQAGAATATELTIAEAELVQKRLELADARLEARAASLRLRYALGALSR